MIIEFIKNHLVAILITLAILLIVSSTVLRVLTPTTPTVPQTEFVTTSITGQQTEFSGIRFTGRQIEGPKELSIAHTAPATNPDTLIKAVAEKLQLELSPSNPNYWTNAQQQTLTFNQLAKQYQLVVISHENIPAPTNSLDQAQIIEKAQQELGVFFPQMPLQAKKDQITFYQSTSESLEGVPFNQADLVSIPFSYFIDGLPVAFQNTSSAPFEVLATKDGQIAVINFYPQFIEITSTEKTKPISVDAATTNINLGKGSIISAYLESEKAVPLNLAQIKSGTMTSVKLEYRLDESINTVYPFYRFEGLAVNGDNNRFQVEIITPAIQTN